MTKKAQGVKNDDALAAAMAAMPNTALPHIIGLSVRAIFQEIWPAANWEQIAQILTGSDGEIAAEKSEILADLFALLHGFRPKKYSPASLAMIVILLGGATQAKWMNTMLKKEAPQPAASPGAADEFPIGHA